MKRVLVLTILGVLAGGRTSLLHAAEAVSVDASEASDDEGIDDESGLEDWEMDGGEEDFSALFDGTHAIGFGLVGLSLPGWSVFYDYNQSQWVFDDKRAQFHYQLSQVGSVQDDIKNVEIATAKQTQLTATIRLLNVRGVFVGAGLGIQETDLTYKPTRYNHEASSIFGLFEGGWQGDNGVFFQIGIRPAFHITTSPAINASIIPDSDGHQISVRRLWRQSQELSGYTLGFGWYLS